MCWYNVCEPPALLCALLHLHQSRVPLYGSGAKCVTSLNPEINVGGCQTRDRFDRLNCVSRFFTLDQPATVGVGSRQHLILLRVPVLNMEWKDAARSYTVQQLQRMPRLRMAF